MTAIIASLTPIRGQTRELYLMQLLAMRTFAEDVIHYVTSGHGKGIQVIEVERKRLGFLSRMPAAHLAICGLAIVGAAVVQFDWDSMLGVTRLPSPSKITIASIITATVWLLGTAWLHRELSRHGPRRLVLARNAARWNLLTDSLLAGVTAAIIWRGHESPLAAKGIWALTPVVLVIAILSAGAIGLARADIAVPLPPGRLIQVLLAVRPLMAALLIVVLGLGSG